MGCATWRESNGLDPVDLGTRVALGDLMRSKVLTASLSIFATLAERANLDYFKATFFSPGRLQASFDWLGISTASSTTTR